MIAPSLACPSQQTGPIAPGKLNVIVIVLDEVGCDRLAMYGPAGCTPIETPPNCFSEVLPVTPALDRLRDCGVMFTSCYVNQMCSPSRATFQTGRYAYRLGMYNQVDPSQGNDSCTGAPYRLLASEVFLPRYLADPTNFPSAIAPGYASAVFGKWHLAANVAVNYCDPIERGYELFQGQMGNPRSHFLWDRVESIAREPFECASASSSMSTTWSAEVTRIDAANWIAEKRAAQQPFFAYVAFSPPHTPLQVPPLEHVHPTTVGLLQRIAASTGCSEYVTPGAVIALAIDACDPATFSLCPDATANAETVRRHARVVFNAMLEEVDYQIGKLLQDQLDDTMVFVIGDNGTPDVFVQAYASSAPPPSGPPYPNLHGKRTPYQLGARVPLIVAGPRAAQGATCTRLVNGTDLFATIARITGANAPAFGTALATDSLSILPLIENPAQAGARRLAFSEWGTKNDCAFIFTPPPSGTLPPALPPGEGYNRALVGERYKYIRFRGGAPIAPSSCSYSQCEQPHYVEEFYDLAVDSNETCNLISSTRLPPEAVQALQSMRVAMDARGGDMSP